MKPIVQCSMCGAWIHVINKRFCCGKDYSILVNHDDTKRREKRKHKSKLSRELRVQIIKRDKKRCIECGGKANLQVHHIVYRKDGGADDPENLTTLCDLCHAEKHRHEPIYNLMLRNIFEIQKICKDVAK